MSEKPILFSTEMVQAILDGRKTQTRRVMKPQPEKDTDGFWKYAGAGWSLNFVPVMPAHSLEKACPYGPIGGELWVRETFFLHEQFDALAPSEVREGAGVWYDEPVAPRLLPQRGRKRASIHMPRWASRIQLEVTDLRVERVQEITEEDAVTEGCKNNVEIYTIQEGIGKGTKDYKGMYAKERFRDLWDSINAGRGYGWEQNPWVWCIEFEVKSVKN